MLIDPHDMLARDVLVLLRKEYSDDEFKESHIHKPRGY